MFSNPGKTLKTFASIIFWIIVISGLIMGIMAFAYAGNPLIAVIGILASGLIAFVIAYILGICLYSFGEVVENTTIIRKCLEKPDCPNKEN